MIVPERIGVRVEPLSDVRWARIERDLFAKLQEPARVATVAPPRRQWSIAWAGALAAAVAVVLGIIVPPWGAYRPDLRMRLATTDGASQFTVGESSLSVAAHSLLMVGGDDERGIDVVLDRGAVTCEVAPRRGRPPFRLDAGEVRIRVIGTRFTVTHSDAETSVDVDHGTVEVSAGGTVAMLHDGDHWPPRPAPPRLGRDTGTASASSPPISTWTPTPPASSAPSRPPRKHPRGVTRPHAEPEPEETPPAVETSAPPPTPAPAPPPSQEIFEDAARLERTNPDEAAAAYRQLAGGGSAWAPNALFALARLEIDRGNRTEGVRLLNDYLTAYPRGMNALDARELLRRLR